MNAVFSSTVLFIYLMSVMIALLVRCSKGATKTKSASEASKQEPKSVKSSLKPVDPTKSSSSTSTSSKRSTYSKLSKKPAFSGFKIQQDEKEEDIKTDLRSLEEEQNPFKEHGKRKKGESKASGKKTIEKTKSVHRTVDKTVKTTKTEETVDPGVEQIFQAPTEGLLLRSQYIGPSQPAKPRLPSKAK
ncbi:unnamed protein product [Cylicocyclus nassatus]|uniref:Uncharacterized protein n=1 Tax=Cylicocyclus nassatus TaxID=53992 RepID=A0AA36MB88_CYLNA|nr:unnamed protein product [Cylicocyclus nassatus]